MGRLSAYAKNQILKLRFQKHNKITQIVKILTKEDIKISRQSVSTFLKKYLETDSILDKPRSGRKKKLTSEEIEQIGELTRADPNITARSIKDKLNLTVSTYTILRASKLFEWNKVNPNSNEAKKAAALEREMRGERRRKAYPKRSGKLVKNMQHTSSTETINYLNQSTSSVELNGNAPSALQIISLNQQQQIDTSTAAGEDNNSTSVHLDDSYDLKLITEREIIQLKNTACSPMSFATKVLFRIFSLHELHGHNVSGKTFHKHISHKEPLEEKRLMYIRWLVEKYFYYPYMDSLAAAANGTPNTVSYANDTNAYYYKSKDVLWKACCNAINKMIRRSEVNQIKLDLASGANVTGAYHSVVLNDNQENLTSSDPQEQPFLVQVASTSNTNNTNTTNLNKFSQLTQYLNDNNVPNTGTVADSSFIIFDEVELISHKRFQHAAKNEDDDDDDSGSEIELLNENKLMMNITNQAANLNNSNTSSKKILSVLYTAAAAEPQAAEEPTPEVRTTRRRAAATAAAQPKTAAATRLSPAAASVSPPEPSAKRSTRLASKKPIVETLLAEKKTIAKKQTTAAKKPTAAKYKRKSNYYYDSDEEDSDDDEEDDDDDEDEDDDIDDTDDEDDDEDSDDEYDDAEEEMIAAKH